MSFDTLGLSADVLRAVVDAGFTDPTPIQREAIPEILHGRDLLGRAQTGTGKTAAFCLPMIDMLAAGRSRARMPRALVLEPTRELAQQVAENFAIYGKYHKLNAALIIGGASMGPQEQALDRGVEVLIATPGRLIDLFERGKVLLNGVGMLVIDEADRMLDMGFIPDVERIVKLLPATRQTLLFSATIPPEIRSLVDRFLSHPKEISIKPSTLAAETIEDAIAIVPERLKREALLRLIETEDVTNAIIFCNRKRDADGLFRSLKRHHLKTGVLHGDLPQSVREETLQGFRDSTIALLVASDVAARGLDIQGLSHVFNYDVPFNPEDYVHRIGRTGRAGQSGRAFTIATAADSKAVAAIESFIKRGIKRIHIEGLSEAEAAPSESREDRKGGRHGGRHRSRHAPREDSAREHARPHRAPHGRGDGEPGPQPAPAAAMAPRSLPPARAEQPPYREREEGERVVGLGDHTPAFLLKSARAR
ncbi:MAG: DEAD/DEAH box helicase [Alphaproteobacteria bacterium]